MGRTDLLVARLAIVAPPGIISQENDHVRWQGRTQFGHDEDTDEGDRSNIQAFEHRAVF